MGPIDSPRSSASREALMKSPMAAVFLLALTAPANVWALDPGSIYLRGSLGYATQSLEDVNDDIAFNAFDLSPLATRLDWDEFGGAVPFGLEVGRQFSDHLSGGIGFTYQKSGVEHFAALDYTDTGSGVS